MKQLFEIVGFAGSLLILVFLIIFSLSQIDYYHLERNKWKCIGFQPTDQGAYCTKYEVIKEKE